jgi:hypothetical protein
MAITTLLMANIIKMMMIHTPELLLITRLGILPSLINQGE